MADQSLHRRIERDRSDAFPDAKAIVEYRRYAEGDHDATISANQRTFLGNASRADHPYADNTCDTICDAAASRLDLTGFVVEDDGVQGFLDGLFVRNQMGDLAYDVHYAAIRDGNCAVTLRWVPDSPGTSQRAGGRVTMEAEGWWNGSAGMFVAFDRTSVPSYAVSDFSEWLNTNTGSGGPDVVRQRRTVYFPDHIERYIKDGQGWAPYPPQGEPSHVLPWTKRNGQPLGVPVIPFANARFGRRRYGTSDLAGGILGNQDHLNDIQIDITAAAKLLAFQLLTATGVEMDGPLVLQPGTMLKSPQPDARFGAIPAGDITQLVEAHDLKLQTIARSSKMPLHLIKGGDWPSGIALVQADKPQILKAMRLAKTIGPSWASLAHRATEITNAYGAQELDEDALITALFAAPERLDPLALAEVRKMEAEAQAAIELLGDEESLLAIGIPLEEARARLARREAVLDRRDALLTGIEAVGEEEE